MMNLVVNLTKFALSVNAAIGISLVSEISGCISSRYKGYWNPTNGTDGPTYSVQHWHILVGRLAFVIVMEVFYSNLKAWVQYGMEVEIGHCRTAPLVPYITAPNNFLQHIVFLLKRFFDYLIPDRSKQLQDRIKREHYLVKRIFAEVNQHEKLRNNTHAGKHVKVSP